YADTLLLYGRMRAIRVRHVAYLQPRAKTIRAAHRTFSTCAEPYGAISQLPRCCTLDDIRGTLETRCGKARHGGGGASREDLCKRRLPSGHELCARGSCWCRDYGGLRADALHAGVAFSIPRPWRSEVAPPPTRQAPRDIRSRDELIRTY